MKNLPLFFLGKVSEKFVTDMGAVRPRQNPNSPLKITKNMKEGEKALRIAVINYPPAPKIIGFLRPILSDN